MENRLIDQWSYSSLMLFMRNRLAFKKKYILKIYDDLSSPSAVVGQAGHKALEVHYKGMSVDQAIQAGLDLINNTSSTGIDFGKTGSMEDILKRYTQAINAYFEELPKVHKVLGIEQGITAKIKDRQGNILGIPAKSFSDLITENEAGELEVIDHKFVSKYTDGEEDQAAYIIQAMFNYHTIEAEYGRAPKRMIFNECKVAKNKDGSAQIQPYVIEYDNQPENFDLFYNIFNDCTKEILKPDVTFLPNFQDMFDGQHSFELYRSSIVGIEAPAAVSHKAKDVQFVEKGYVASKTDLLPNADLTDEERIRLKLQEFGISVQMQETHMGAAITQYTMKPSRGVKMSKFDGLASDLALALQAHSIRIEAPIRGTNMVGVEVPAATRQRIDFTEKHLVPDTLNIPVGVDVMGKLVHKDLAEMPHLLIAGSTGSGKSVMLNVIITALTKQMQPEKMKLILIDPKRVELSQFANLPHLMSPVIFDNDKAAKAVEWLVGEMESRYQQLEAQGYRYIDDYNANVAQQMPKIIVVIDEFADLMMSATGSTGETLTDNLKLFTEITNNVAYQKLVGDGKKITQKDMREIIKAVVQEATPDTEQSIIRLAQKARAVGIHLILATQRPSADVVTGLIKANVPTKIAFMTTSKVNSLVILDQIGAEELTGKGDMLLLDPSESRLRRLQGLYC